MNTSHLDPEALSAALDGAASAEEGAHLSRCRDCRAQLESLAADVQAVMQALGSPVTPGSAADVDAAIARALAEMPAEAAATEWPSTDRPVFLTDSGLGGTASSASDRIPPGPDGRPVRTLAGRGSGRSRWVAVASSIAAAIVVVGGAVAVTRGGSGSHASTASVAAPTGATTAPPSSKVASTDLGAQSDPAAVARLVTAALSAVPATAPGADASPAAVTPSALGNTAQGETSGGAASVRNCATAGRAAVGLGGDPGAVVRFSARLQWQGQPAVVFAYLRPGASAGVAGVVMKSADCSVLAVLPL